MPSRMPVISDFKALQHSIVTHLLEKIDDKTCIRDEWQRPDESGMGITCIMEQGTCFERAGVGFSHITGDALPSSATILRPHLAGLPYEVAGVSLVFHPRNPYVPTVHMNIRCFMAFPKEEEPIWWFGGGMDLTPYYGFEEDAIEFHQHCKLALEPYGTDRYPLYKAACDRYFFLKHRNEPRGIGGIFFDDVNDAPFETVFAMVKNVAYHFQTVYTAIVERRKDHPYTEKECHFQRYRRGRYVEFNLVYDRGTLFGLQSGGRTESILLSMPPAVEWAYQWSPEPDSPEARLYSDFLIERDWLSSTPTHSFTSTLI